jgi:hypothetical protein
MKKTIVAAVSIAVLLFTSSGASAQLCVLGLFFAAAHAGSHEKRELTTEEAWSCGLLYATKDKSKDVSKTPTPKKVARRAKSE